MSQAAPQGYLSPAHGWRSWDREKCGKNSNPSITGLNCLLLPLTNRGLLASVFSSVKSVLWVVIIVRVSLWLKPATNPYSSAQTQHWGEAGFSDTWCHQDSTGSTSGGDLKNLWRVSGHQISLWPLENMILPHKCGGLEAGDLGCSLPSLGLSFPSLK